MYFIPYFAYSEVSWITHKLALTWVLVFTSPPSRLLSTRLTGGNVMAPAGPDLPTSVWSSAPWTVPQAETTAGFRSTKQIVGETSSRSKSQKVTRDLEEKLSP